jgi:uncharacterized delta-60 repeat protein
MKTSSVIFVLTLSALLSCFAQSVATAADCYLLSPGCLDATFGTGTGKVLINTDGNISSSLDLDSAKGVAIQADGKILAAGDTTLPGNIYKFVVVRVNADGGLDPTFGGTGMVTTSFSSGSDRAYAVALQSDGKIVVAGTASAGSRIIFAVARYNQLDGSLDATFGSGGKTTVSFGSNPQTGDTEARSIAIQPDGKIVVAGFTGSSGALARLNSNGSLDTSFGGGGKVTSSILGGPTVAVALQPDGKMLLGGSTSTRKAGLNFAVLRYNANGTVDTAFGSAGLATADFAGFDDRIRALAVDANNNIVAAGYARTSSGAVSSNFGVARFTPSGVLDSTFGTGGRVVTDVFGNWDDCYALVIEANGKIIADGFSYDASGVQSYFTIVRYNTNGTLDGNFGAGGIVTTNMASGPDNFAYGLAIESDGKIVAGGTADTPNSNSGFYLALARYSP